MEILPVEIMSPGEPVITCKTCGEWFCPMTKVECEQGICLDCYLSMFREDPYPRPRELKVVKCFGKVKNYNVYRKIHPVCRSRI